MDGLQNLNSEQREAALHKEGPLLILAGAGSGKTATMTHRIAHLIKDEYVPSYRILAVTFTNKAAKEMRERVEKLVDIDQGMWILTFHAMCLRVLRKNADRLGYTKSFAVYDPSDQKTVMKNVIKEMGVINKDITPQYALAVISKCKEKMEGPDKYYSRNESNPKAKDIAEAYRKYDLVLKKNNAMDFDDLLLNTVRLFRDNDDVLAYYQDRFQYIMVDEYQDTNHIQYLIVKQLAERHQNICVVGDDDQCIYEWRGADINNILDFEKDFENTKIIKLEENYRSTGNILRAAHSVIKNNTGRKDKELWTSGDDGDKLEYIRDFTEKEEASGIARRIRIMVQNGASYRDFAVLYRINALSRTFEEAFLAEGIPYQLLGGIRYYDRKEIKDIMSYMRLVQNPSDDVALIRVINEPKRGVGAKTLDKLRALSELRRMSIFETISDPEVQAALPGKAGRKIAEFAECIKKYADEQENLRISDIYDGLLRDSGYLGALMEQDTLEAESREENLMEFRSVIQEYEKEDPMMSLSEFLEKIALVADIDNRDADEDAVVLMTLHSAKGLEFPVVFMPAMEEGIFPGFRAMETISGIEEERRLCYVGITRAKRKLYLSSAERRMLYGNTNYTEESRFLEEIDPACMTGEAVRSRKKEKKAPASGFKKAEPFDPFKAMQRIQSSVQVKNKGISLAAGDTVKHAKFGEGIVLETDGTAAKIMFDSVGVKKLLIDVAPLKKI